MNFEEKETT